MKALIKIQETLEDPKKSFNIAIVVILITLAIGVALNAAGIIDVR